MNSDLSDSRSSILVIGTNLAGQEGIVYNLEFSGLILSLSISFDTVSKLELYSLNIYLWR